MQVYYYYSSDIGGFKTEKLKGYGSFSLNYKNKAAIYLTKIYIEEQSFEEALKYILLADTAYHIQYNCGTSHRSYTNQLKYLYASSYEGLEQYDKAMESILPNCFDWQLSSIFVRVIKKRYTRDELIKEMDNAIENFEFTQDLNYTESHITQNAGNKNEETTVKKYLSGKAAITFFDYYIELPKMSLENGEAATKKMYVKSLRKSNFHKALTGKESNNQNILSEGIITIQSW